MYEIYYSREPNVLQEVKGDSSKEKLTGKVVKTFETWDTEGQQFLFNHPHEGFLSVREV